ncbi:unnamed protein product [Camellia sinensis]
MPASFSDSHQSQDDDLDNDDEENEDDDDLDQQQQSEFEEDPQSGSTDLAPIARESEVLSDGGVRISHFPPMIKHTVNRPHSSVLAIVALEKAIQCGEGKNLQNGVILENVSRGQLQALSAVPADSPVLAGDQGSSSTAAYVITPPPVMEGRGVVKRFGANRVHVVPMHADKWCHIFSPGKSTEHRPEKYMECRNWIVAKYMENPEMRLSVDDFRELVAGIDIDDLTRIVRFLDHWGVINYCAFAPNCEHRSDGSYLKEDSNGEVHVPSAALKSIDSLIRFDKPKCWYKAADVYPSLSCHDGEESDLDSRIRERLSENRCNCCSCPLPIVYYQSQKETYITYPKEEEAVRCIQSVHGFTLDGRSLRACFGTTKYCHAWLRNVSCSNPDCLYLHEIGTQEDSFTKDGIISAYTSWSAAAAAAAASVLLQNFAGRLLLQCCCEAGCY